MSSIQSIVAMERNRIIFKIIAENNFKRELIRDWIDVFGKSGNVVSGRVHMDTDYNQTRYRKLFETLGIAWGDVDTMWRNDAVEHLHFGLQNGFPPDTGPSYYDRTYGDYYDCSNTNTISYRTETKYYADINNDKDLFINFLLDVNTKFGSIDRVVIRKSRQFIADGSTSQKAIDNAIASATTTGGSFSTISKFRKVSDGTYVLAESYYNLINASYRYDDNLSSGIFDSKTGILSTNVDYLQYIGSYWDYNDEKTRAYVTVTWDETFSISSRNVFDAFGYWNNIYAHWYTIGGVAGNCDGRIVNAYVYRDAFTEAINSIVPLADWTIPVVDKYYVLNIDYNKYLQAPAWEVVEVFSKSLHFWIEQDSGGFFGSVFGGFIKFLLFTAAIVLIAYTVYYGAMLSAAIGSFGFSIPSIAAKILTVIAVTIIGILTTILALGTVYLFGAITGDYNMVGFLNKVYVVSGAVISASALLSTKLAETGLLQMANMSFATYNTIVNTAAAFDTSEFQLPPPDKASSYEDLDASALYNSYANDSYYEESSYYTDYNAPFDFDKYTSQNAVGYA